MPINKAIIYEALGADPARDRWVRDSPSGRTTIVALGATEQAPAVAADLAARGAGLIELCGGISPVWRPRVAASVGGRALVSSVTFGIESLAQAAEFSRAFDEGRPPREAFIFLEAEAVPTDRFVRAFPPQHTTFVPVESEMDGVAAAADLARDGWGLIELYGGFSDRGAADVIEVVASRAAVGVGAFTLEAVLRSN